MRVGPRHALPFAALAVLAVLISVPNHPGSRVPSEDAGAFFYIGRLLADGGAPYRDVWDHKPPAIYVIDAVALAAGGPGGVWILEVGALAAAAWLSFAALARPFGARPAFFASAAWLLAAPRLFLEEGVQTSFVELFALPLQFGSLLLLADAARPPVITWRLAAIGALGGMAALLKPTVLAVWLAIALVLTVRHAHLARWHGLARGTLALAGSAAVVVGSAALWLGSGGALGDAIDQVLRYNTAYTAFATVGDRLGTTAGGVRLLLPSGLAILAAGGAVVGWLERRGSAAPLRSDLVAVGLVALPIELAFASAGRGYHYYFIAWLPACAVLTAVLTERVLRMIPARFAAFALAGALVVMSVRPAMLVGRLAAASDDGVSREAAAYVQRATRADERVLVWGSRPEVYVLAERAAATRFFYQYAPLATRGYASRVDELMGDLERGRPALIIDASNDSFVTPPLDRAGLTAWSSPEQQYAWPAETARIVDFVESNYERSAVLPRSGWTVWRLRAR